MRANGDNGLEIEVWGEVFGNLRALTGVIQGQRSCFPCLLMVISFGEGLGRVGLLCEHGFPCPDFWKLRR